MEIMESIISQCFVNGSFMAKEDFEGHFVNFVGTFRNVLAHNFTSYKSKRTIFNYFSALTPLRYKLTKLFLDLLIILNSYVLK